MSRKDSRGMFSNVLGTLNQSEPTTPSASPSPHLRKVAAGIRQIQEREESLDRILKEGDRIIELNVDDIGPSPIQDRIDGSYDDAAVADILESMRERGQIVPGLVRPVDDGKHHYQIVFGRRRLIAARKLGIPFRAIVKELSDEQAIIYQGEENTNRDDLSFVEKSLFAQAQETAGFRRDVICASLSTTKSHLSEMLRVASTVPRNVLVLIGRAPDTGRRRWIDFVELWLARPDAFQRVNNALKEDAQIPVSDRFAIALAALNGGSQPQANATPARREIRANGYLLATLAQSKSGSKLNFGRDVPQGFIDFLTEQIAELHEQYVKEQNEG